jgi:hypothetical protein
MKNDLFSVNRCWSEVDENIGLAIAVFGVKRLGKSKIATAPARNTLMLVNIRENLGNKATLCGDIVQHQ